MAGLTAAMGAFGLLALKAHNFVGKSEKALASGFERSGKRKTVLRLGKEFSQKRKARFQAAVQVMREAGFLFSTSREACRYEALSEITQTPRLAGDLTWKPEAGPTAARCKKAFTSGIGASSGILKTERLLPGRQTVRFRAAGQGRPMKFQCPLKRCQ
ncbi:MAG: hypothetical protein DBY17_08605 [Oscillospiraceae bacterium]|nr:MAG: hypothetical protein DBY17_08605 [Oscillospiraceae bacterium]